MPQYLGTRPNLINKDQIHWESEFEMQSGSAWAIGDQCVTLMTKLDGVLSCKSDLAFEAILPAAIIMIPDPLLSRRLGAVVQSTETSLTCSLANLVDASGGQNLLQ